MNEFKIKSSKTDNELVLTNLKGDYFKANIKSSHFNIEREIYAYTDTNSLAEIIEHLADQEKPWEGEINWNSIEGEFKFAATCSKTGKVTFTIELLNNTSSENWLFSTEIISEFGQLPMLAKTAREFFSE